MVAPDAVIVAVGADVTVTVFELVDVQLPLATVTVYIPEARTFESVAVVAPVDHV